MKIIVFYNIYVENINFGLRLGVFLCIKAADRLVLRFLSMTNEKAIAKDTPVEV